MILRSMEKKRIPDPRAVGGIGTDVRRESDAGMEWQMKKKRTITCSPRGYRSGVCRSGMVRDGDGKPGNL